MAVIGNVIARVGADVRPFQGGLRNAQRSLTSFQSGVTKSLSMVKAAQAAAFAALGVGVGSIVNDAMKYEAALQRINFMFGNNSKDINAWANNQAAAFNVSRSEAAEYAATYGNLLGSFTKDTQELSNYTIKLLEASAIVASATGRTIEDTMDRIRSGLLGNTESIEDLGINVNVAMIESTNAFKKFANGKSWQQLSFQTQQQIRLFAILEQATNKYGNSLYANTKTNLGTFTSTIKNAALNIGIGLLPVINAVLPALNSLAVGFERVTKVFADFMQIVFGYKLAQSQTTKTAKQAATAQNQMGDAVKKAGKKASDGLQGFDELNVLQKEIADGADAVSDSMGGNAASGGGGTVETPTVDINPLMVAFETVRSKIAEVTGILNQTFGDSAARAFYTIKDSVTNLGIGLGIFGDTVWDTFKSSVLEYMKNTDWSTNIGNLNSAISNLGGYVSGVFDAWNKVLGIVDQVIEKNFDTIVGSVSSFWTGVTDLATSLVYLGTAIPKDSVDLFKKSIDTASDTLAKVFDTAIKVSSGLLEGIGTLFSTTATGIKKVYDDNIEPVKELWLKAFNGISDVVKSLVENVINPLLLPVFTSISDTVGSVMPQVWDNISKTFGDAIILIKDFYNTVLSPLVKFIGNEMLPTIKPIFEAIGQAFKDVFTSAMGLVKDITQVLKGLIEFLAGTFTGDWDKAWNGVKDIFKGVFEGLVNIARLPLNNLIRIINIFLDKLSSIKINIPQVDIPGVGKMGGGSIGFPKLSIGEIPALADGGVVASPTLALIGEAGPEAVVPLGNNSYLDNSGVIDAIDRLIDAVYATRQEGADVNIDGHTAGRLLYRWINAEDRRQGDAMITIA